MQVQLLMLMIACTSNQGIVALRVAEDTGGAETVELSEGRERDSAEESLPDVDSEASDTGEVLDTGSESERVACVFVVEDPAYDSATTCEFTPPEDGWLHVYVENPDASMDGAFFVYETTRGRLPHLYTCTGPQSFYYPLCDTGRERYDLYIDVEGGEALELDLSYSISVGSEFTGTDTLTVSYEAGRSILDGKGALVTSLNAGPNDLSAEAEAEITVASGGGVVLEAVLAGSGGGGHILYLDGQGQAEIRTGDLDVWGPVAYIIEPGTYDLLLTHEDDDGGNTGDRQVDVYEYAP